LFLLEGLPAIFLSFVALFKLPDYPETAKILTDEEREFAKHRLSATAPSGEKGHWDFSSLLTLIKDPTFSTFTAFWICHGIGGFGVGVALPTVIYELGFTTTSNTQLMNMVFANLYIKSIHQDFNLCILTQPPSRPTSPPASFSISWDIFYRKRKSDHGQQRYRVRSVISFIPSAYKVTGALIFPS
jgi:hypothetical protein